MEVVLRKILVLLMLCVAVMPSMTEAAQPKAPPLTHEMQMEMIRQDFQKTLSQQGNDGIGSDIYLTFNFIKSRNKKQAPVVSYAVAKRVVEHVRADARFEDHLSYVGLLSLVVGLIQQESGFNPWAVSNKDARGLMQVHLPTWGGGIINKQSVHDIQHNLVFGTSILFSYLKKTGDLRKALHRYYGAKDDKYVMSVLSHAVKFKKFYEGNHNAVVALISDEQIMKASYSGH